MKTDTQQFTTFLFICIWFNTLIASVTLPVIPEMNEGGDSVQNLYCQ